MRHDSKIYTFDVESISETVISLVVNATAKITPLTLEKQLVEKYELNKKQIKSVFRDLVDAGELAYTYEYGRTFLERSFARPVRISQHIVLQPPGHHHNANPGDVIVNIKPGASFGVGNHPTTRLAIRGIEWVLLGDPFHDQTNAARVLDVGTGSGVLLITAILCGMQMGLGVDIDACARVEAVENVRINGLEDRVAISGQSIAGICQRFSLILANLRYPSLKKMRFQIDKRANTTCFLILSGIREEELDDLLKAYQQINFEKMWSEDELGWSGVVLRRVK
jgi:ribosomal protein L11 methyltransferase